MKKKFTLIVEEIESDETKDVFQLEYFHDECYQGGVIVNKGRNSDWAYWIHCRRCGILIGIKRTDDNLLSIVQTAADGIPRKLKTGFLERYDVYVIQKKKNTREDIFGGVVEQVEKKLPCNRERSAIPTSRQKKPSKSKSTDCIVRSNNKDADANYMSIGKDGLFVRTFVSKVLSRTITKGVIKLFKL